MDFSGVRSNYPKYKNSFSSENENYRVLQKTEIKGISEKCDELPSYDSVITIGMGGSVRGSKAVTSLLGSRDHYVARHPEYSEMDSIISRVDNPILHLSSKSGRTVETIAMFNYLFEKLDTDTEEVVVTTHEDSELATFAKERDFTLFESSSRITGRFSVFSYYGMVPSYLCGVDISDMCSVARDGFDSNSASKRLGIGISESTDSEVLFLGSYSKRLQNFNEWAEQLWSESLGKQGNGTHISTGIGPNLQHSRLQRLIGGADNISVVLVMLEEKTENRTSTDYRKTNQTSLEDIMRTSFEKTRETINKNGVPCIPVTLLRTESSVAELMCAFEIAVIQRGKLRKIETFSQDAVEDTKHQILDDIQE